MPGSNKYLNYSNVTLTPGTGTPIVLTDITKVDVHKGNKTEEWRSSGHHFATLVVGTDRERGVTITSDAINLLDSISEDVSYTITWSILDAKNGTGSGSMNFTLANATRTDGPFSANHNRRITGTITFVSYSTDGTTDPLTVAVTP